MKGLQRFIIGIYRFLGLLSIPALTVVTTISMANLFTAGKAAQWDNISVVWAWIYAAAIETNVVRLFTEKRKASFALGLGLGVVTCIALQFEGMQQTGSMMWNNPTVQLLLPWIIALRSILVYVLIAYEGRRLMQDDKQSNSPKRTFLPFKHLLDTYAPVQIEQVEQVSEQHSVAPEPLSVKQIEQPKPKLKVVTKSDESLDQLLREQPDLPNREIARRTGFAPSTVGERRKKMSVEQQAV